MWRAGDTREVSDNRAHELIESGFAIEASAATKEAREKHPLQDVADAIGATIGGSKDVTPKKKKPKPGQDRETK